MKFNTLKLNDQMRSRTAIDRVHLNFLSISISNEMNTIRLGDFKLYMYLGRIKSNQQKKTSSCFSDTFFYVISRRFFHRPTF